MIYTTRIRRIVNILYAIAAIVILCSAIFKIQHFPYGNILHNVGFGLGIIVAGVDNLFLRKELENREKKNLKD